MIGVWSSKQTGYILTKPLNHFLAEHRGFNDWLAGINTVIGVLGPFAYMVYQTLWVGDYEVVFRYLAISAIRSLCGWVTYLPPDATYLVSYYDFPDIAQCLMKDCGDPRDAQVQPFVSLFSGHVGEYQEEWVQQKCVSKSLHLVESVSLTHVWTFDCFV